MTDPTACSGIRATPEIKKIVRKILRCGEVVFMSEEQKDALQAVVLGKQRTRLVVVLPTGGEKSLFSVAPARVDVPSMTIVVVPHLSYRHHRSNSQKQLDLEAWRRCENSGKVVWPSTFQERDFQVGHETSRSRPWALKIEPGSCTLDFESTIISWNVCITTAVQLLVTNTMVISSDPDTFQTRLPCSGIAASRDVAEFL